MAQLIVNMVKISVDNTIVICYNVHRGKTLICDSSLNITTAAADYIKNIIKLIERDLPMKKTILFFLLTVILCLSLVGCDTNANGSISDGIDASKADGSQVDTESPDWSYAQNTDTITISVEPSSAALTEAEFEIVFHNTEDTVFTVDRSYKLYYDDNGVWQQVPFSSDYSVIEDALIAGDGTKLSFSLKDHDFDFTAGKYCVEKTVLGTALYAEFELG